MRVAGFSKHKQHGAEAKKVKRSWHPSHIAAGYHEQEFGPHAHSDHHLLGVHKGLHGDVHVSYLEQGETGPEFQIAFDGGQGHQVTVLDEFTVREYLALEGIEEHVEWSRLHHLHQEAIEHDNNRAGFQSLIADIRAGIEEGGEERVKQLEREYPERS
jgi:hypothetical protein